MIPNVKKQLKNFGSFQGQLSKARFQLLLPTYKEI